MVSMLEMFAHGVLFHDHENGNSKELLQNNRGFLKTRLEFDNEYKKLIKLEVDEKVVQIKSIKRDFVRQSNINSLVE